MIDYVAPDPAFAEMVRYVEHESNEASRRLQYATIELIRRVALNPLESRATRGSAVVLLIKRRDPQLADVLLQLFDDPDQHLWRMAMGAYRVEDPRIVARLYHLLDDPDESNASEAAVALASSQDESILPHLVRWLHHGDRSHRNVAVECLRLHATEEADQILRDHWDRSENDEDRLVIAGALLSRGDTCGLFLLDAVAREAISSWAVHAATAIYRYDLTGGLKRMLDILGNGDLEAKQAMVGQIWNFANLPHAFTIDGLVEAQCWVEQQLQNYGA